MTPIPALVPPEVFKDMLLKYGYRVEEENEDRWTLFKMDSVRPVITLPKRGKVLAVDIMMGILNQIRMDNGTYFRFLREVTSQASR